MLKVKCNRCGSVLQEPGALAFDVPVDNQAEKLHICVMCWPKVYYGITGVSVAYTPQQDAQFVLTEIRTRGPVSPRYAESILGAYITPAAVCVAIQTLVDSGQLRLNSAMELEYVS